MQDKTNQKNRAVQVRPPIAGIIPGDYSIEFIGIRETKSVFTLQNGKCIPFCNIPGELKAKLFALMLSDEKAISDLRHMDEEDALERFVFCLFGDVDHMPDVTACGQISPSENFRCGTDCTCLGWSTKSITINGAALTARQVQVTDELASDKPDKLIAHEMGISLGTLVTHKRNLYEKAGVMSRPGLVEKAFNERIIRHGHTV